LAAGYLRSGDLSDESINVVLSQNWIGAKVSDADALEEGEAGLYRDDLDA